MVLINLYLPPHCDRTITNNNNNNNVTSPPNNTTTNHSNNSTTNLYIQKSTIGLQSQHATSAIKRCQKAAARVYRNLGRPHKGLQEQGAERCVMGRSFIRLLDCKKCRDFTRQDFARANPHLKLAEPTIPKKSHHESCPNFTFPKDLSIIPNCYYHLIQGMSIFMSDWEAQYPLEQLTSPKCRLCNLSRTRSNYLKNFCCVWEECASDVGLCHVVQVY